MTNIHIAQEQPELRKVISWSMVGNLANAATQLLLLIVVVRLGDPSQVGQYGLGLALSVPVFLLVGLSLRNLLVTDVTNSFQDRHYLILRISSSVIGFLLLLVICVFMRYDFETILVILALGLTRAVESISDMFQGFFQRAERMDLAATSMIAKSLIALPTFALVLGLTHSLALGLAAVAVVWTVRLITFDVRYYLNNLRLPSLPSSDGPTPDGPFRCFGPITKTDIGATRTLAAMAAPIGLSSVLISLTTNIPRYLLEYSYGALALGIFTVLSYPLAASGTIVNSLSQAFLPRLSRLHESGEALGFQRLVRRMMFIGLGMAICVPFAAAAVGEHVLLHLFGRQYTHNMPAFLVLSIGVGLSFPSWLLNSIILSVRSFRFLAFVQVSVFLLIAVASIWIVPSHGVNGAAFAVTGSMAAQVAAKGAYILWLPRRHPVLASVPLAVKQSPATRHADAGGRIYG